MAYEEPITDYDKIVENCTCAFCGSNCDDLDILVKDNHVAGVRHACRLGASKIMEDEDQRLTVPMMRDENGELEEVDWDTALDAAAELLANSVRPLLYGWSETSIECMKKGLELTEYIGAVIDNQATICHGPTVQAVQNVGYPLMSLGEVKNRADMVVYTGSNPMNAHPRHLARYTTFPRGWFRPRGRFDRKLVTWDPKFSDTAKMSDIWVPFEENGDYEFVNAIRAVLKGKKLKKDVISGIPKEDIINLTEEMKNVQFGALFFGLGLTHTLSKQRNIDIAIGLVQDLNAYTKWVLLPMRGHFNVNGFNIFMAYQMGFPYGVDFSRGYPRYMIGETTTIDLLNRKEPDVFMVIAADPGAHFPGGANMHLADIPVIQIDIHWGPSTELADIVFPGTFIGVETAGTSYRMDSVPIHMKSAIDPPETCREDEWIVNELLQRVKKIKEAKQASK